LLNPRTGGPEEKSPWLVVGKEYDVLGVYFQLKRHIVQVRLLGDSQPTPVLHDLAQFEVVDPRIPRSWVFWLGSEQDVVLEPEPWRSPGFWEKFFNGEEAAVKTFEHERSKMLGA